MIQTSKHDMLYTYRVNKSMADLPRARKHAAPMVILVLAIVLCAVVTLGVYTAHKAISQHADISSQYQSVAVLGAQQLEELRTDGWKSLAVMKLRPILQDKNVAFIKLTDSQGQEVLYLGTRFEKKQESQGDGASDHALVTRTYRGRRGESMTLTLGVHGPSVAGVSPALATSVFSGATVSAIVASWLMLRWRSRHAKHLHRLHTNIRRSLLEAPIKPMRLNGRSEFAYLDSAFNELSTKLSMQRRVIAELSRQVAGSREESDHERRKMRVDLADEASYLNSTVQKLSDCIVEHETVVRNGLDNIAAVCNRLTSKPHLSPELLREVKNAHRDTTILQLMTASQCIGARMIAGQMVTVRATRSVSELLSGIGPKLQQLAQLSDVSLSIDEASLLPSVYIDEAVVSHIILTLCAKAIAQHKPEKLCIVASTSGSVVDISVRLMPYEAATTTSASVDSQQSGAGTSGISSWIREEQIQILAKSSYGRVVYDRSESLASIRLPVDQSAQVLDHFLGTKPGTEPNTNVAVVFVSVTNDQSVSQTLELVSRLVGPFAFVYLSDDRQTVVAADYEESCSYRMRKLIKTEVGRNSGSEDGMQYSTVVCSRSQAEACILNTLTLNQSYELRGAA